MIVTYKDIHSIKFPVFVLPNENWYKADGVLFLDGMVLDETKMPGTSLGIRRLQSGRQDLHPLRRAVIDIPSLLRCKYTRFIDAAGKPFVYTKTQSSKLSSYLIKDVERKDSASLLWVHEVPYPFTIARPPYNDPTWVRILHLGDEPWIVYDYIRENIKTTYRRV